MSIRNVLTKLNNRDTKLFPNFPKLVKTSKFILFAIILAFSVFLTNQVLAITINNSAAATKYNSKQNAIQKGNNQESWMNESLMSNAVSLNQAIAGTIPENVLNGSSTSWVPGGMIGYTNQAIASLYNPPASGVQYIADTFNNFLGKPTYAADTNGSFNSLKGILPIWKSFRNAVYILFSLVFIGIGIAIMLRVKISQQAVITIQSAIPQLITSLVLVTFSYAIAGLLIDLSYLIQGVILSIIFNGNTTLFPSTDLINPTFSQLMTANFGDIFGLAMKGVPIASLILIATTITAVVVGAVAGFSLGALAVPALGFGALALALIILIMFIMIFAYVVKFFFGMVKCYINIILRIILAPLEIGMGAIPNSKMNFSSWAWNLIANLAVFPIAILFLVLINVIIQSINSKSLWNPPMLGDSWIIAPALGFVGLMILSKLPTLVPEAIFQIKPSPFGKAIGEGFAPIEKLAKTGANYGTLKAGEKVESWGGTGTNPWRKGAGFLGRFMQYAGGKKP